ncbi:MAG TPA: DNA polymerase III subunit gamma/tau [Candidatus Limnocylindria bacterium]|nr:DNA polymerase III subunit gamma/tau [Candidatus Limnocylindria bacterium]
MYGTEAMSTSLPTDSPPAPTATPGGDQPADQPADQHKALYRRWRSQRFAEVLGQDAIVTTLRRAVATDRLAHAYLFVGPRGTGKTSTARILAKAINCTNRGEDGEPCDTCAACVSIREGRAMDVIEIDAASHGLVEDARDLVMRALTAPSELRRRVYIIDEVHMLSTHAFNALLKMVEEPPPHVVFVLATTDTHKVPATMISRTQRFDFRRLPTDAIAGKLGRIVDAEEADAEPEALTLIARLADGGMRDAESLLDQVLAFAGERLTAEDVREAVGLADDEAIVALVDAYVAGDAGAALDGIEGLVDRGRDMGQVAAQAEVEARRRLLAAAADPQLARRLAHILRTVAEAAGAGAREGRARLALELLAVDGLAPTAEAPAVAVAAARPVAPKPAPEVAKVERSGPPLAPKPAVQATSAPAARQAAAVEEQAAPEPEPVAATPGERPEVAELRARWGEVVQKAAPAIKPLLSDCRPVSVDGARLTLAFPEERAFMREKARTRAPAIEQLLAQVLGGAWAIDCVASNVELEPLSVAQAVVADPSDADGQALLDGVLRITGGELVDVPEVR